MFMTYSNNCTVYEAGGGGGGKQADTSVEMRANLLWGITKEKREYGSKRKRCE